MLSEKAKGKRRASDTEDETELQHLFKDLIVRFTEGIPDLTLQVAEKDNIRDVKQKIREARSQLQNRRLKLILAGQLLADNVALYTRLAALELRQRRAASNDVASESPREQGTSTIWLHCSVGPQLTDGEEEEETQVQSAQLKPLRGFDRLAAAGFSEQDIANIRLQFHANSAGDYIDQDFVDDDDFDDYARTLEEQWIDSLDNGGGGPLSQSSSRSTATIMNGVIVGFLFPLMPFFFSGTQKTASFWEDGTAHENQGGIVFSRTMQVGIVIGFIFNILFGVWTYLVT
ncbi:hypothetical protein POSPLADRAFT_1159803 [Postia placenta MAD-698-R-SB12]|uniref:Ubiquitin-like domain-containing protein n=1 Tax=Postia placenta MAD-698-R-SB12 TaxID=670580 RepID=A0A1X6MJH7_9APHY|nr:hypothetical protein POSPLADRAFT_1159803 [Postia placenta MAD-698-R-SB12]OSX56396.1 hypothetical protein POSPLADRAFT_1159803 [Postia placenta MAD-698-R-SB12]